MLRKILIAAACVLTLSVMAQVKTYEEIKYPEAKAPVIVKPVKFELKNGLTVLLLEDRQLPVISGEIRFHAGSVRDPEGKEGLAGILGDTMRTGGNARMTGDEMDDFLESIAASVESYAGDTSNGVRFTCLTDNILEVLPLFRETILRPVFDPEKLAVTKSQMKTEVVRRNDDPKAIAAREFSRRVNGLHSPLSAMMELASIDAVTPEDLAAFHQAYLVPNNAVLAVWGDFDRKEMKKRLTAMFQEWKPKKVEAADLAIQSEPAGVYFVPREGVTQSNIRVGHLGVQRNNPDYPAIAAFNMLLGGGFDSRMMKIIRRDKGLSYSPHGQISSNWDYPGQFWMNVNTKLESTGEVLDILKQIITDMQTEGVTQEELDIAKDGFLNSFAFQFDSLDKIIGRALTYEFNGYPADFAENLFKGIKAVTTDDVQRVAQQYVDLDKLIILVVGDAGKFDKPLSAFGPVTEVDVTIPKPKAEPAAAASEESLQQGAMLMQKAMERIDPEGRFDTVRVWKIEGKVVVKRGSMEIPMDMMGATRFSDATVIVMKTAMGDMKTLVTPEKAEMSMGPQARPLPAEQRDEMLKGIAQSVPMVARQVRGDKPKANFLGKGDFQGTEAALVAVTIGEDTVTYAIGEGFVILGTSEQVTDPTGSLVEAVTVWSDWQDFGGILFPKTRVQTVGENGQTMTLTSLTLDPEDADALFQ